jgi:hypothetical protein
MVGGMGWIYLAQVTDYWHVLINMLMNFHIPENAGNFFTS